MNAAAHIELIGMRGQFGSGVTDWTTGLGRMVRCGEVAFVSQLLTQCGTAAGEVAVAKALGPG